MNCVIYALVPINCDARDLRLRIVMNSGRIVRYDILVGYRVIDRCLISKDYRHLVPSTSLRDDQVSHASLSDRQEALLHVIDRNRIAKSCAHSIVVNLLALGKPIGLKIPERRCVLLCQTFKILYSLRSNSKKESLSDKQFEFGTKLHAIPLNWVGKAERRAS
jgi:hypothetical protein